MNKTKIEWCDYTWNPVTGCTPISPGCNNCYAESIHKRFNDWPFSQIAVFDERLDQPEKIKKPSNIFVCSMGDLLHKDVSIVQIKNIFYVIERCQQHTFFVLTKRPGRLRIFSSIFKNVFMGVSIENANFMKRARVLRERTNYKSFISFEPLIGFISRPALSVAYLTDWIIVGGESGPNARKCQPDWVRTIERFCNDEHIPFFFKGWGKHIPPGQEKGKLDGIVYQEYPEGMKRAK
jgi:protein gp37